MSRSCNCVADQGIEIPVRYQEPFQRWMPTTANPYPMNFVQAPSLSNQVLVRYQNQPFTQGLSTILGPQMFPFYERNCNPRNAWERKYTSLVGCNRDRPNPNAIAYPTTHSIPGPLLQSYIRLPYRMYSY